MAAKATSRMQTIAVQEGCYAASRNIYRRLRTSETIPRRSPLAVRRLSSHVAATSPSLPLDGVRICDLTRVLAGPFCTQLLGDLGAEIIKIEHPVRGDDTRQWGPPFAAPKTEFPEGYQGESAYFVAVNRNKKSVGLNFADKRGQDILRKIIATSDVVVENFTSGTLLKYGLDYDTLRETMPNGKQIVYASITGYGQTGPYRTKPGYDVMVAAEFGLMHITGEPERPPSKVGIAATDVATGLFAHGAIMAALLQRYKTGEGQYIDICLSDCQVATLVNVASSELISNFETKSGRLGTAHPSIVPYSAFQTADSYIVLGGTTDKFFRSICVVLEHPEWGIDKRFENNAMRVVNRKILEKKIEEITITQPTRVWLEKLANSGVPHAKINDIEQTLRHEQIKARRLIQTVDHRVCGKLPIVGHPIKYSLAAPTIRSAPPLLGEHTDEVLHSMGYDNSQLVKWKDEGVISNS